ncbi:hypothetical protein F4679DRAFT_521860 [Xylaria curta]|nr:hypothetical protein F4679DRAFT_521860 [Xylaria curta]
MMLGTHGTIFRITPSFHLTYLYSIIYRPRYPPNQQLIVSTQQQYRVSPSPLILVLLSRSVFLLSITVRFGIFFLVRLGGFCIFFSSPGIISDVWLGDLGYGWMYVGKSVG